MYDLTSLTLEEHEEKSSTYVSAIVNMTSWPSTRVKLCKLNRGISYMVLDALFRIPDLQKARWAKAGIGCLPFYHTLMISYVYINPDQTERQIRSAFWYLSDETFSKTFNELIKAQEIQIAFSTKDLRYYVSLRDEYDMKLIDQNAPLIRALKDAGSNSS